MLRCKDATRLASQSMERPLTVGEQLGLRWHLLICVSCRRAERQFKFLRDAAKVWRSGQD